MKKAINIMQMSAWAAVYYTFEGTCDIPLKLVESLLWDHDGNMPVELFNELSRRMTASMEYHPYGNCDDVFGCYDTYWKRVIAEDNGVLHYSTRSMDLIIGYDSTARRLVLSGLNFYRGSDYITLADESQFVSFLLGVQGERDTYIAENGGWDTDSYYRLSLNAQRFFYWEIPDFFQKSSDDKNWENVTGLTLSAEGLDVDGNMIPFRRSYDTPGFLFFYNNGTSYRINPAYTGQVNKLSRDQILYRYTV